MRTVESYLLSVEAFFPKTTMMTTKAILLLILRNYCFFLLSELDVGNDVARNIANNGHDYAEWNPRAGLQNLITIMKVAETASNRITYRFSFTIRTEAVSLYRKLL